MSKIPINELLRLACIYAEMDRQSFAECNNKNSEEYKTAMSFVDQINKYRVKRWGKTQYESDIENCTSFINVSDLVINGKNNVRQ